MSPDAPILILGAGGFIGRHVVCAARGGRWSGSVMEGPRWRDHPTSTVFADALARHLDRAEPTVLVNAVGGTTGDLEALNVAPLDAILDVWTRRGGVDSLVQLGSAAEYGVNARPMRESDVAAPVTPYGRVKLRATAHARELGARSVVLRPFSVVGAGMSAGTVIGRVGRELALGAREVWTGRLSAVRDFVAAEDVAEAILRAARSVGSDGRACGEILNVGTGRGATVREMVDLVVAGAVPPVIVHEATGADPVTRAVAEPVKAEDILGWTSRIGPAAMAASVVEHRIASAEA